MAFVSGISFTTFSHQNGLRARVCRTRRTSVNRLRMNADEDSDSPPPPVPQVSNQAASRQKLIRNVSDKQKGLGEYAQSSAGDMVGAPKVGEGMGPKRGTAEKKVTRAAAIQKSQTFADAWAEQNQGRFDVWLVIGLLTLLTPIFGLIFGVTSGAIPIGGLFEG